VTTIATDGFELAGDGKSTANDSITGLNRKKVWHLEDGSIVGGAGQVRDVYRAVRALAENSNDEAEGDYNLLRLFPNGKLVRYDSSLDTPISVKAPQAIGTGSDVAVGAMLAGASAREAVKIASKVDVYTGGKITSYSR
jgi:ATP-dependent protease HslVU (ClpYQ) peptidase subunit